MKITDIEAIHVRQEVPNMAFDGSYDDCIIRVSTDDGITGIGEVESLAPAIKAIVNARPAHNRAWGLRELLCGRDPTRIDELWQLMYDSTCYVGRRGIIMHAIGGIDLALWDIKGQAEGKPIWELLGGRRRARIEAYGTIYPMARTTEEVEGQVEYAMRRLRLRHIKFAADPWWMDDLDLIRRLLLAARRVLGADGRMIVDAALAYRSVKDALKLVPVLKEAGVYLFEAPLPLDDVVEHARLAAEGLPLGAGDLGLTHVDEFIEFMDRGGVSICQPDITMVGGFTGIRQIAEAVRARGKRIMTHGYKTNIEIAANLHFLANHWADELLEYSVSASPLRWGMSEEPLEIGDDGRVAVPDCPGLGVHLNSRTVEKYRVC